MSDTDAPAAPSEDASRDTSDDPDASVSAQVAAELAAALTGAGDQVGLDEPKPIPRRWRRLGRHGKPRRRRRRWVRILAALGVLLVLVASGGAAFAYWYSHHLYDRIHKVTLPAGLTRHRAIPLPTGSTGSGGVPAMPEPPVNILVVGSDTRSDLSKADASHYGNTTQVAGQRSDTIMVMRIGPTGVTEAMSIPRDLYVKIPGTRGSDRINTTFNSGPALLIKTVEQDLGIPIDYYAAIDFSGFRAVVFALSGVQVCIQYPERDSFSGLNLTHGGCQILDPESALAFVRARHLELKGPNGWYYDPTSDFARMKNQQLFIKAVAQRAQSEGLGNPLRINSILRAIPRAFTVDSRLTFTQMLRLAQRFRQNGSLNIDTMTLPAVDLHGIYSGGVEAAVLQLQEPQAGQMLALFHDQTENLGPRPLARPGKTAAYV